MIPRGVLDALVVVTAAIWTALGLTILLDRYRYDRRTRRTASLQHRLRLASASAPESARRLTPADFQEMVFAGLPRDVEYTIAHELYARTGDRKLRLIADGTLAADTPSRIRALQVLVSASRPDAYYALDRSLRSGERDVASAAVRMLIRVDDRRAADILVAALCDGAYTASRLAAAIDRMSVPRSDVLAPLLAHPHGAQRFWGVRLAGRLRAREWAPRVRELTADPDPLVRRAAVEALGAVGTPKDCVLLLTRFLDPVAMVRVHAARASANFYGTAVADGLSELLADREWIVRAAARDALRRLGDIATPAVIRTLWEEDTFAANSAAEVFVASGAALATARRLLADPDDEATRGVMGRLLAVAGDHLERALLNQLGPTDAAHLMWLIQATREPLRQ